MTNPSAKVALVTGASSGIGKAIAERLIEDGITVIVAARSYDKMADLETRGAHRLHLDVTNEESIQNAVSEILTTYGVVDVLVNNAGFGCYGAVEDVTLDDARYQFEVNLFGLARLTQLLLPKMREKGAGKIINMSSMGGKVYAPLGAWYHASKHALEGWSDCLRLEVSQFGINVVIIEPGVIKTEFDDVLSGPMLKRSGAGAYGKMTQILAKATEENYAAGNASPPSVIADVVSKAVKASQPRTRYAAGKLAKPLIFIRTWLGDRFFDRIVMSMLK
ncbi:MAG: SDR family NAD(P)-dependent oxidoreductase [Spirulinaceae cyanobacterium SM2_1_0]|nr:SDR family NAD(P)-dependent oxidoreductase [Spirulinaceae cyanobacterium SM2_1_0]